MNYVEIFGLFASVIIAISLMMKSIVRLRLINMVGALLLSGYGLMIGSIPVFVLNLFIAAIDLFFFIKMKQEKDYFYLQKAIDKDSPWVQRFINFYIQDITKHCPAFHMKDLGKYEVYFVLRNLLPVGLFVIMQKDEGKTVHVVADYVIPQYRDMKNAHYVFCKDNGYFQKRGFLKFTSSSQTKKHNKYLEQLGFEYHSQEKLYIKNIQKLERTTDQR